MCFHIWVFSFPFHTAKLLLFNVHHHKLLPESQRVSASYSKSDDAEVKKRSPFQKGFPNFFVFSFVLRKTLWRAEFGESLAVYLTSINAPPPSELMNSYTCDHCETSIAPPVRYHCQVCKDFDLCQKCQQTVKQFTSKHLATHTVFALPVVKWTFYQKAWPKGYRNDCRRCFS